MNKINERLGSIKKSLEKGQVTIMILGLGSVGSYLLEYLASQNDESIRLVVVGRDRKKMELSTNIIKVGATIRRQMKSKVYIESGIDFNNIEQIEKCISKYNPDFIVNSSRVYSGIKYGSISWNDLRAYGIWTPLAIKLIKNIMSAVENTNSNAIVINTSYSDAVIPWLKSAGYYYPDLGSGNINHLIPRIKYAAANILNISDFWNIEIMLATSHFHNVVISKEGHNEGEEQLLKIFYLGNEVYIEQSEIFKLCKINMPTDSKRNIMNASSNFEIIMSILEALKHEKKIKIFSPGALGEIGGYPVIVDGKQLLMYIDESIYTMDEMRNANKKSIAFDGVENVEDGCLIYTDELVKNVFEKFHVNLPKRVSFDKIDEVAELLINSIIIKKNG